LAGLVILAGCAPQSTVKVNPLPGVEVAVPIPEGTASGGASALAIKVLPGNPLPEPGKVFWDDFSRYPTGAVLPVVNPKEYGFLRLEENWQEATIVEAFDPSGKLDKALRLAGYDGDGFLTTGAVDWTDYEVSFRLKIEKPRTWNSAMGFRLFLSGAGDRSLELRVGREGLRLDKLSGEQRFTLVDRRELAQTTGTFVDDKNWHNLRFVLEKSGRVRFWLDDTLLLDWTDPDYHAGGFGVGPLGAVAFLDDLKIRQLE